MIQYGTVRYKWVARTNMRSRGGSFNSSPPFVEACIIVKRGKLGAVAPCGREKIAIKKGGINFYMRCMYVYVRFPEGGPNWGNRQLERYAALHLDFR